MRFGLPKWTHEAFFGERLWSACAKNTRARAKTTEITIYLPVVTMYANVFVFGTNFVQIWGDFERLLERFWHPKSSNFCNFYGRCGIWFGLINLIC